MMMSSACIEAVAVWIRHEMCEYEWESEQGSMYMQVTAHRRECVGCLQA